jgi:hypothetical protein
MGRASGQIADARSCCENAPLSSNRGMVAAASPSPRHDDVLVTLPGRVPLLRPPAFEADVVAFVTSSDPSPPRRTAVLRL